MLRRDGAGSGGWGLGCKRWEPVGKADTILVLQVFQCLLIEGENSGEEALREAQQFVISDDEFEGFLDRHKEVSCLVPESNQKVV